MLLDILVQGTSASPSGQSIRDARSARLGGELGTRREAQGGRRPEKDGRWGRHQVYHAISHNWRLLQIWRSDAFLDRERWGEVDTIGG
jgi:hypothetical protein